MPHFKKFRRVLRAPNRIRSSSCDAGRRETAVAPHPESMRVRSIGSEHIRSHAAFSNPTTSAVWPREQPPCSYHL